MGRRTAEPARPAIASITIEPFCTGYVSESGGIAGRETNAGTGEDELSSGIVTLATGDRNVFNISLLPLADGDRVHVYGQDGGASFCRPFYEDEAAVTFHNE